MGETADADGPLTPREAAARALAIREPALERQSTGRVDPGAGVAGRVVADPVVAPDDHPAHSIATMDGYAFDPADGYPLSIVDEEAFPEDEPPEIDAGEAVRVATGAPVPERATAVLLVEEATVDGDELIGPELDAGTDVYRRGSNVAAGETLFSPGERLSGKDAVLLADLGVSPLVRDPFSVAVLATGSEIDAGKQPDRDSPMLCELVRSWGHDPTYAGSVPDDYDAVLSRVEELAAAHDVVLTTGGTSVGAKDFVGRAFADLGTVSFQGVSVRPGGPLVAAAFDGAVGFGVPGKPIGAHTVSLLALRPFFTGETRLPTVPATLSCDLPVPDRDGSFAVPVVLAGEADADGAEAATPLGHRSSELALFETFDPNVLSSATRATRADGFVLTDEGLREGQSVRVVPYDAVE